MHACMHVYKSLSKGQLHSQRATILKKKWNEKQQKEVRVKKKKTHSLSTLENKEVVLALVLLHVGLSNLLAISPIHKMTLGSHTRLFTTPLAALSLLRN